MQFKKAARLDPQEVFFTQSKVQPVFARGGKRVLDIIRDIERGDMRVEDLPPVTVIVGAGGNKFCLDNRRLYVLKDLRSKMLLPDNMVTVLLRNATPRELVRYTADKCSQSGTILKEKERELNEGGEDCGGEGAIFVRPDVTSTETDIASVREKNDKKKNRISRDAESARGHYLRQKIIIEEKRKEYEMQAAARQQRRQLETEKQEYLKMASHEQLAQHDDADDNLDVKCDDTISGDEESGDDYEEEEEEEEVYSCDVCRKEFKSVQQTEQHFITKAHKKKLKEFNKKLGNRGPNEVKSEVKIIIRPKKRKKKLPKSTMAMTVDIAGSSIDNNTLRVAETSSDEEVDKRHVERSASPSDAHDDSSLFSGGDSDSVDDEDTRKESLTEKIAISPKRNPVDEALMLLLIQKKISQLEVTAREKSTQGDVEFEDDDFNSNNQDSRMTAGSLESREIIARMEQRRADERNNQQLTKSFQFEGVGSKALPSQYVHKEDAAFDARRAENIHHRSSHYVMAGGVQFQRGVRVKGVVSRHSRQAAIRNGPVGGGAHNMKRMGLLHEQRETGSKKKSSGKKKKKKNTLDI